MRGLGRIFRLGLFTDYNELPSLSNRATSAPTSRVLHQCQDDSCGGFRRTRRPEPICKGRQHQRHTPKSMEPVEDRGQRNTLHLLVNEEE